MAVSQEVIQADVLEQLELIATQRLSGAEAGLVGRFIRGMYAGVPPGDLLKQRPEHLYAAGVSLLEFARRRAPGQALVRAYRPTLDEHGWQSPHTIGEVVTDDMPFLVDSVGARLQQLDAEVQLFVHPIFVIRRAVDGALEDAVLADAEQQPGQESCMQIHVRVQPSEFFPRIEASLRSVLDDVRAAVEDFSEMRARSDELCRKLEKAAARELESRDEVVAFLDWLNADHFTYLGYRHCSLRGNNSHPTLESTSGSGLGILRDSAREVLEQLQPLSPREALRIFKANVRSTVHRPVHLDALVLPDLDSDASEDGGSVGVHIFVGLFTLSAYSRSPDSIPLLRHKIEQALERSRLQRNTHDSKALRYILETYPRDELFQADIDTLLSIGLGILHIQNRHRVALFVRTDPFHRFVSCLVYLPKDRLDTTLRLRIQDILTEAFRGSISAFYTHLGDQPLARLHLIVKTPGKSTTFVDHAALERKLWDATRSWSDRLHAALINEHGEEKGTRIARRYLKALPTSYTEAFDEHTAVVDIEMIELSIEHKRREVHLYRRSGAAPHELSLKLYNPTGFVQLSDVLPMLENMGLRVVSELPFDIRVEQIGADVWVHDFALQTEECVPVELAAIEENFIEVFRCTLEGALENDGFNRLVLHAGLASSEVRLIRSYARYLRQTGVPFSQVYMQTTLKRNPRIAKALVELFAAKFRPPGAKRASRPPTLPESEMRAEILRDLDLVDSLDEDRILRRFLSAIDATLRTNFYQLDTEGHAKDYISIKLDSQRVDGLPAPRPYREIFVFSSHVEGIHLRFGPVARGGLRWSDRLEDFRTEVLGLVKAQRVKNSVIVPVGSKGGFVVKRPPPAEEGRDAFLREGIACYQTFIQGLLDVTDNREGDDIIPPRGVVCLDAPDPYLVVAADKGTATFSDIANEISQRYGFWLDDAFASGGSAGYDHKKMAITARGAWESVKRHFRELDKDTQRQPFTVVGVGDMSGDVFGNGMLLSEQIRLIAAFNHLHIFIDPDPDPAVSFAERKRLFDLPRSSWADYDSKLISKGGGVFDRKAKSIQLSAENQRALGIEVSSVTPNELISHILRADVELLFFGGIGTYIKGKDESHADVGDRANDGLRIDAHELRAKVISEGANLGMTQRGRVEYALHGGHCNTDFIDNSAGVDCSDHEVNIKILLGEVERAGELTREQRNVLLHQMTDEVAALVLRDNYLQTQTLTVTQHVGVRYTDRLARYMRLLEQEAGLDRSLEHLPDQETLVERGHSGMGFCRPELCVLVSYAKNFLFERLLESALPDEPFFEGELVEYFPTPLRERYRPWIVKHRLRRELIATIVANDLINRVGITFLLEIGERVGMPIAQVTQAYVIARELHAMPALWSQIETLDNRVPASAQAMMLMEAGRLLVSTTAWLLRTYGMSLNVSLHVEEYREGVVELAGQLDAQLGAEERTLLNARVVGLTKQGVPDEMARAVAKLPLLSSACDIVAVAREVGSSVDVVARLYYHVGHRLGFEWLRRMARTLPSERAWDKQAIASVLDELLSTQRGLVRSMLTSESNASSLDDAIASWGESRGPLFTRTQHLLTELQATPSPDFAMLAVANQQLKAMLLGANA